MNSGALFNIVHWTIIYFHNCGLSESSINHCYNIFFTLQELMVKSVQFTNLVMLRMLLSNLMLRSHNHS